MDNSKFNKLVTIIIPVYNGDKYLFDSLSSAVHQSYREIEIIVIDDGSEKNNNYKPILKIFKDFNVKFIKKRKNAGVSSVMNLAIKKSKGYYINWLSHDDLFHPLKIEKQIETLKKNKLINSICCCHSISFNEETKYTRKIKLNNSFIQNPNRLLSSDKLHGCSLLIPKHLIISAGFFDKELKFTQDYDMWMRLFDRGANLILCDEYLLFSRKHALQDSVSKYEKVYREKNDFYFSKLSKFFDKNPITFNSSVSIFNIFFSFIYRGYPQILINFLYNYNPKNFINKFLYVFIFVFSLIVCLPIFIIKKLIIYILLKLNFFK